MANEFKIKNGLALSSNGVTMTMIDGSGNLRLPSMLMAYNGQDYTPGTAGQYLKSTGTGLEWSTVSAASSVSTLTDVTLSNLAANNLLKYDGTKWINTNTLTSTTLNNTTFTGSITAGAGTGTSGQVLTSTGSGVQWSDATGGGGGTGTVNTGTAGKLAYYPSSSAAVSALTAIGWNAGTTTLSLTGTFSATTLTGSLAASNLTGTIAAARLPTATTSALGAVKVDGTTITIDGNGVISSSGTGSGSVTSVSAGTGLTGGPITSTGTLSIDNTVVATLTDAQTLTNKTLNSPVVTGTITAGGGVGSSGQVLTSTGSGVQWSTVSGGGGNYTLPIASVSVLGGIKIGSGLQIANDGTVAVTGASGSTASGVVPYDFGYITETIMTMQDHGSIV